MRRAYGNNRFGRHNLLMTEFIVIIQKEFNPQNESDIISIDGKAERGTVRENGRNPDID